MLAAWASVNWISVELTTRTAVIAVLLTRSRELLLNPTPRTDTTVPAGNQPSPGMTLVIATLPPTVTVAGDTLVPATVPDTVVRSIVPFRFQSDDGSSVN